MQPPSFDHVLRSTDDFFTHLVAHSRTHISFLNHPVYHCLRKGELDMGGLRVLIQQIHLHLLGAAQLVFDELHQAYTNHDPDLLVGYRNIYDEELGRNGRPSHLDDLALLGSAIGLTAEQLRPSAMLPETQEAVKQLVCLSQSPFPLNAIGLNVAIDVDGVVTGALLDEGSRWSRLLERHYGLTSHQVSFFRVHEIEDGAHLHQLRGLVEKYCTTLDAQGAAWEALNVSLQARWLLDDGVFKTIANRA